MDADGCKAPFPESELARTLPPKTITLYVLSLSICLPIWFSGRAELLAAGRPGLRGQRDLGLLTFARMAKSHGVGFR